MPRHRLGCWRCWASAAFNGIKHSIWFSPVGIWCRRGRKGLICGWDIAFRGSAWGRSWHSVRTRPCRSTGRLWRRIGRRLDPGPLRRWRHARGHPRHRRRLLDLNDSRLLIRLTSTRDRRRDTRRFLKRGRLDLGLRNAVASITGPLPHSCLFRGRLFVHGQTGMLGLLVLIGTSLGASITGFPLLILKLPGVLSVTGNLFAIVIFRVEVLSGPFVDIDGLKKTPHFLIATHFPPWGEDFIGITKVSDFVNNDAHNFFDRGVITRGQMFEDPPLIDKSPGRSIIQDRAHR